MYKLGLEKAEEPEFKLPIFVGSSRKQGNSQKTFTSASLTTLKPLIVCITTNWKILKKTEIPDYLTCFLRNLYAGQEATVRSRHGTKDWFKIRKGVREGCILTLCLFSLYLEYIMQNARLGESQAEIRIARRNSSYLSYADDTTLIAESKEELKSLLMKVKEESEKLASNSTFKETKILASVAISSWQIDGETVTDFIFL